MATAARLGSRVDAGLLAGCVVLSLVAIALPTERPRADRERAAAHDRRAARRTAARRRALAHRVGDRASSASSPPTRSRCAPSRRRRSQLENDQLRKMIGLGIAPRVGLRPRRGAAQHGAERGHRHDAHADGREHARESSSTARSSRRRDWSARSRRPIRR